MPTREEMFAETRGGKINESDEGYYGPLRVLDISPAGYYIGRMFHAMEGWQEPGSRESGYYPKTDEGLQQAYNDLVSGNYDRDCIENKLLYEG